MFPFIVLLEDLYDQMNVDPSTSAPAQIAQYQRKINEAYRDVAGMWPWNTLKKTVTLASTYLCPADMLRPLRIIDTNKQGYNFIGGVNRISKFNYNWYFTDMIATPLASGNTLHIGEYDTALTSTAEFPATTCAGEFIRIGSNVGIYKIAAWISTSAMTLTDHFRGDALSEETFSVRPVGTQVLAFSNAAGTALTPTDVELTYIRKPLPLYRDDDIVELPGDCAAVRIKALQKILALNKYDRAADRRNIDFKDALTTMKAQETKVSITEPDKLFARRATNSNQNQMRMQLTGY